MCNQIEEAGDAVARLILPDPPTAPPTIKDERAKAKAMRSEEWSRASAVMPAIAQILCLTLSA